MIPVCMHLRPGYCLACDTGVHCLTCLDDMLDAMRHVPEVVMRMSMKDVTELYGV